MSIRCLLFGHDWETERFYYRKDIGGYTDKDVCQRFRKGDPRGGW